MQIKIYKNQAQVHRKGWPTTLGLIREHPIAKH